MLQARLAPKPVIRKTSLYGSLSFRFVAFLIDSTLLTFSYALIFYSATEDTQLGLRWKESIVDSNLSLYTVALALKALFLNPYFLVAHWLYFTLLEASPRQATIGKFALGIKVTGHSGKRISLIKSNLRYISKITFSAPLLLGFLWIKNKRKQQTLYDHISRTLVVYRDNHR